jgi:uncharacterized protein
MSEELVRAMKQRMRADLTEALRSRRSGDAALLRCLLAAIDNAEAPPLPSGSTGPDSMAPDSMTPGGAEIARLVLSQAELREILLTEIRERESAASQLAELGQAGRADALRAEARLAAHYID